MRKILFIVPHRKNRSPGQRFRFEQYFDFLKENGFKITYSNIITEKDDAIFYSRGKLLIKLIILLKSIFIRSRDVFRASKYDIIFIYREALMLGTTIFERLFSQSKAKLIFDFDDAIWLNDISEGNESLRWMKQPAKVTSILKLADTIFAGNDYLATYARDFNNNVLVIPTVINTEYHKKIPVEKKNNSICIGWTGTSTTIKHFELALPLLRELKNIYNDRIYFKVIVDIPYTVKDLDIFSIKWNINSEIEDLSEIDIGIMPLPDDDWAKGKCGFKGLQYMALEIPVIMSPVGVNNLIIKDGINGFLANTKDEWIEKAGLLIESEELRSRLGKNGRETVIEKYSVESQKHNYLKTLNDCIAEG